MKAIPPLASLKAFEAVVRNRGFSRAAEELGMTQSAVSQHVKLLEEKLHCQLLVRQVRGSVTTMQGQKLFDAVTEGLNRISDVCEQIRQETVGGERSLLVSTLPGFAVKWLFPRLMCFDQAHPDLEISIITQSQRAYSAGGRADVAIRYGLGHYPDLYAERVFDDHLFPVVSPRVLQQGRPLKQPIDLSAYTILQDEIPAIQGVKPGWHTWLRAVGLKETVIKRSRRFSQSNMVIQAAIAGMGVALGRDVLAIDDLLSGQLVRPFSPLVPSGYGYYLVCSHKSLQNPKVQYFRDWLLAEAAQLPPLPAALAD